jgi:putative methionine-R-sulfoxide reductase with GAF domain
MMTHQDAINLDLLKVITSSDIKDLCTNITSCLEKHYTFDGIGFFLLVNGSPRTHFFTQTIPNDVVQGLEKILPSISQAKEIKHNNLIYIAKQGDLAVFNLQEYPESIEPMGIAFPLCIQDQALGTMAMVAKPATIKDLMTEKVSLPSFVPIISGLLANAISHEKKDKKIHMLNFYQTVSSSMSYIGDLQELLTTIVSIVTSELLCEECSVLFYDEENNELEFFTAVGETGMHLVKERFPSDKGIAGRVLRERAAQVVNDVQSHPDFYRSFDEKHNFKTKSILAVPLIAGEEPVGVLNAINKVESKLFDKQDDQVLSAIADEVALAVKNARIFEYVVDSYCKIRQGKNSCKGCKRPLKTWTPCVKYLNL